MGINMKIIFADLVGLAARDGVSLPTHVLMFISYFDIISLRASLAVFFCSNADKLDSTRN